MNLKEAFRFQNKLQQLMSEAQYILMDEENITVTKNVLLRKRVMPEAEDEITILAAPSEYADRINDVVGMLSWLLSCHEKLAKAIRRAKNALPIDMDGEVGLNKQRQEMAKALRRMTKLRGSEKMLTGGGRGYRFNVEGNQVSYCCDIKHVVTINFDRKMVRNVAAALERQADKVSAELDSCLINSNVDFPLPFDVNDSFDEVFEVYRSKGR